MKNVDKLKEQMNALFEKTEDKVIIDALTDISATINDIEADTTALQEDNRTLLYDYKELVKHTSFKMDTPPERVNVEPPKLEDFLTKFKS